MRSVFYIFEVLKTLKLFKFNKVVVTDVRVGRNIHYLLWHSDEDHALCPVHS